MMHVHHLAFRTRQVERLVAFYRDALGLAENRRTLGPDGELRSVWLAMGDARLMLEAATDAEPNIPEGSLELVAFAAPDHDRDRLVAVLDALGIPIEAKTEFTVYFRDPDGRRIGVSSRPW